MGVGSVRFGSVSVSHRKIRPTQLWVELSWVVAIGNPIHMERYNDLLYENLRPVEPKGVNYVYLTFEPRNICTCRSPKFCLKIQNFKLI